MGKLLYIANISLDGYTADRAGDFGFSVPTPEVFSPILELVRSAGTHVYGREMYDVMALWETAHLTPDAPSFLPDLGELERNFAHVWRAAEKLVISTTLAAPTTQRTRVTRSRRLGGVHSTPRGSHSLSRRSRSVD